MRARPNLVLIGFMATGKSTIGARCARALGYVLRDSDLLVEQRAGKSVAQVFAEQGEEAFRLLEGEVIRELSRQKGLVIATGGGVPLSGVNVARLRRTGVVVLLDLSVDEIVRRAVRRSTRPLLAGAVDVRERVAEMLAARMPLYQAAAHCIVSTTGLDAGEAARRVMAVYHEACARGGPVTPTPEDV